jgi:hypothetical protein
MTKAIRPVALWERNSKKQTRKHESTKVLSPDVTALKPDVFVSTAPLPSTRLSKCKSKHESPKKNESPKEHVSNEKVRDGVLLNKILQP